MKKIVVISVIALFVGVGIQPALANDVSKSMTSDDTIPPDMILLWETEEQSHHKWFILFRALCWDNQSGMLKVEFYLNNLLHTIIPYRGWMPFEERFVWWFYNVSLEFLKTATFKFIAYDRAYNTATIEVNGLDISYDVVENNFGFQPAFAVESRISADNIEKVEDCDCQEDENILGNFCNRLRNLIDNLYDFADKNLEPRTIFYDFFYMVAFLLEMEIWYRFCY